MFAKEAIRKVLERDNSLLDAPASRVLAALKQQFGIEPSRKHIYGVRKEIIQQMKEHPVLNGAPRGEEQTVREKNNEARKGFDKGFCKALDTVKAVVKLADDVGGLSVLVDLVHELQEMGLK